MLKKITPDMPNLSEASKKSCQVENFKRILWYFQDLKQNGGIWGLKFDTKLRNFKSAIR